jgi:hypothetical protein
MFARFDFPRPPRFRTWLQLSLQLSDLFDLRLGPEPYSFSANQPDARRRDFSCFNPELKGRAPNAGGGRSLVSVEELSLHARRFYHVRLTVVNDCCNFTVP